MNGSLGAERARPVRADQVVVHEGAQVVVVEHLDLLDLVRGAEAVEEVEERARALERRRLGDRARSPDLLDRASEEHGPAGRAGGHDVGVVAEDREPLRRERARGDVEDRAVSSPAILYMFGIISSRPWLAVKVVAQRAGLERAVDRPGRAALGLHLLDGGTVPQRLVRPCAAHWSADSPIADDGVIG